MSSLMQTPVKQRTFLGHPIGLYILFFTEMWERFSYYGMRALLMLYMLNYFKWSQKEASTYYKIYTSLVYVTPILGGYLADRYLGNKKAVIIGAILMAIGHFLMAFEDFPIFISALIFLMIGNGFFKPNMSTQVGRLYPANDGRRDGAYTIFYMGINLGAFLSPLVCGWLAANTVGGYHSGFTMAGIGMIFGLTIYLLGQPLVREIDTSGPAATSETAGQKTEPAAGSILAETEAVMARGPDGVSTTPRFEDMVVSKPSDPAAAALPPKTGHALTEAEAAGQPSIFGGLAATLPLLLAVLGAVLLLATPVLLLLKWIEVMNGVMLAIGGGCLILIAFVSGKVLGGMRDRVIAILILGVFVMFFWAAFEQAGNVLNVWADKNTNRYLTQDAPEASVIPEVVEDQPKTNAEGKEEARPRVGLLERFQNMFKLKPTPADKPQESWGEWFKKSFNPVTAEWFQSINALAIFLIAPLFAWMWVYLDRRGWQPSIPMKMMLGLLMMSASMAIMIAAAKAENRHTPVKLQGSELPPGLELEGNKLAHKDKDGKVEAFQAGRLIYDKATNTFEMDGVLADNERDLIIEQTAPKEFREKVEELMKASEKFDDDKNLKEVVVKLNAEPPGFAMKYAGIKKSILQYRESDNSLVAYQKLADKEVKGLLVAAGEPNLRATVHKLYTESNKFTVSPWWLFWSYILATLGELCLSPVGLSMVSKLAPAKFATMLMGVWMLTSAFGNYAAGAMGEIWGTIPPIDFFLLATAVVGGAAVVLLVLVKLVVGTMHGVK